MKGKAGTREEKGPLPYVKPLQSATRGIHAPQLRRSLGETAISRYKHLIGPTLRACNLPGQQSEVALAVHALNRMIRTAKPVSVRVA